MPEIPYPAELDEAFPISVPGDKLRTHNEARVVIFSAYYTPEGQQKNITIRADSLEELFTEHTWLENFIVERGWLPMPPNLQLPRAQPQGTSTSFTPPMPEEPVYEDIQSGPLKLAVQAVELNFTKSGAHPGTPFLKLTVNYPGITKPVMAWFKSFDKLGVSTALMPNQVTHQIPPPIKYVHVEQGVDQKNQPEWQVKFFSAQ